MNYRNYEDEWTQLCEQSGSVTCVTGQMCGTLPKGQH